MMALTLGDVILLAPYNQPELPVPVVARIPEDLNLASFYPLAVKE
jgi:hypothetical protein